MARWVQKVNEDGSSRFVPVDESAARADAGVAVHGDIQSFVSPIDGSVITDRKQYREHCKKHNVVPSAEFSDEFIARKQKERERLFTGEHTREETLARKQELYEVLTRAERQ